MHDPKRLKVAFDAVVTLVPRCSPAGVVAATRRAMPDDHVGRPLLPLTASAAAAADDDDSKPVVFKMGNAGFDLAAWACVWDFDVAGDVVE